MIGAVVSKPQFSFDSESDIVPQNVIDPSAASETSALIFDTTPMIVNPDDSLNLDCGVAGDYRYCHWTHNGQGPRTIQVIDVHEGYIGGVSKPAVTKGNECGIVIDSVTIEDHGSWTCNVFVRGNTLQATKNVTVTIKPTQPILQARSRPLTVQEYDSEAFSCSVAAARPVVQISWFLGEEDITYSSQVTNILTDNMGTYRSTSDLMYTFHAWNNKQAVKCVINHPTLPEPVSDYVDITVKYKPWGKDEKVYGIQLGHDAEARLNFSANPDPMSLSWGYGMDFDAIQPDLPIPSDENRYSTEMIMMDDGHYSVILRVLEFDEMDAKMNFKIRVGNDLGSRDFQISLSNEKAPNEPLSSGALAGIVLLVLFIIFSLFCCVYLRMNHLYCFAQRAESKAYIQDHEAHDYQQHQGGLGGAQNNAIKISNDQLNGKMVAPDANVNTVASFNGNGKATAIDHNDFTPVADQKINTDV